MARHTPLHRRNDSPLHFNHCMQGLKQQGDPLTDQPWQSRRRYTDAMAVPFTSSTGCKGRIGREQRTGVHNSIAVLVEAIKQRRGGAAAEAPSAVGEPPGWRAAAGPCTAQGMFARSSLADGATPLLPSQTAFSVQESNGLNLPDLVQTNNVEHFLSGDANVSVQQSVMLTKGRGT